MVRCTWLFSETERPLPYHSTGNVGAAHPDVPSRSHHSRTVRSGSQFSSSQTFTSSTASPMGAKLPPGQDGGTATGGHEDVLRAGDLVGRRPPQLADRFEDVVHPVDV